MKELYILPFDHRGSFIPLFGMDENNLTPENISKLADYKHVVYEGFLEALTMGVPKNKAAVLVDEQFGAQIHAEAKRDGITHILTIEKSGQDEFDFEYGDAFDEHIDRIQPDYVKVLVRYNSSGDQALNQRQATRLKKVSDFCHSHNYFFLFELLAPATKSQLESVGGSKEKYDTEIRWTVMRDSIQELQRAGVEPDIWKVEGLEDMGQMKAVSEITRAGGRDRVGVVVLGRGESETKVRIWLSVGAKTPGVVGFAVGRTVFKSVLVDLHNQIISRREASEKIAHNFKAFVDLFEAAKA